MHILITGIGGFVGPRLARHLLARGDRVSGTYRRRRRRTCRGSRVALRGRPAGRRGASRARCGDAAPDAIVDLAGLSHVGESWQRMGDYFRVNVVGTENLLARRRRAAGGGRLERRGLRRRAGRRAADRRRAAPVDPRTPYALTKAAAERLAFARGAVVARSFNLIGPGQAPNFALPAFAEQLAAIAPGRAGAGAQGGEPLGPPRLRARRRRRRGLPRCWPRRAGRESVYNLACGRACVDRRSPRPADGLSGVEARVEQDPERMRAGRLAPAGGRPGRLRDLGWEPRRSLDEALADLWSQVSPVREDSSPA